jgi:hypothetical protein
MSTSASLAGGHRHVIAGEHANQAAAAKLALMAGEHMEIKSKHTDGNEGSAVESARETGAFLTVREAATWIEARRGRRPSTSTIYRWAMAGVGGHRLASTLRDGVLHVTEDDLANFCQTRDWPARPGRPRTATAEKFLKNQMLLPFDWSDSSLSLPCGTAAE